MINGCIAGDRTCQTKLYEHFAPRMLGLCMRYSSNREEAEDILLEGFLRVFTYIRNFKGLGSLESWIRKIMINAALLRFRNKSNLYPIIQVSNEKVPLTTVEPSIFSDLDNKELLKLIQSLPSGYRLVFNLYVFEGYKHREIAEILGISEGTSKSNLSDARIILQKALSANTEMVHFK